MKQYQITGLGPKNSVTGLMKLFTRLPNPFEVDDAWLEQQTKAPAIGDVLEVTEAGAIVLVTEPQAAADKAAEEPGADGEQKKNPTSAESGDGSGHSLFRTFKAKPVIVHASEISHVGSTESDGSVSITLSGGGTKIATAEMLSRIVPQVGDYWIMVPQDNGTYEYLNPKAVFESKYDLVTE